MAYVGKTQLTFVIVAPPELEEEGDRLFRSHAPWMEATHPRDGDAALLSYEVSKAPELSNPMDPSSAPTGNICYVLAETYETAAGVANHFREAEASWQDFGALLEWLGKCSIHGAPTAPIVNSLW